jgi:hypothetical protein
LVIPYVRNAQTSATTDAIAGIMGTEVDLAIVSVLPPRVVSLKASVATGGEKLPDN